MRAAACTARISPDPIRAFSARDSISTPFGERVAASQLDLRA